MGCSLWPKSGLYWNSLERLAVEKLVCTKRLIRVHAYTTVDYCSSWQRVRLSFISILGVSSSSAANPNILGRNPANPRPRSINPTLSTLRRHTTAILRPSGSEYPNSRVLGPKLHTLNGFWALKPYYLGTWTVEGPYTYSQ